MGPIRQPALGYRQRALKVLADLPPFSRVLDQLLATLSSDSVPMNRIADIIETDTVIAGNVLKLVNSALYGRRGTVNSIRHAISLLGINKLRNAVFAMSITRVWSKVHTPAGWSTARFNRHSVACGLLTDYLAQKVPVNYPEGAFAAGLFHDLGYLLIAVGLHAQYKEILDLHAAGEASLMECEQKVLGLTHGDLAASALELWNLPQAIQTAVRNHHTPDQEPVATEGTYPLALAVSCANTYLESHEIGLFEPGAHEVPDGAEPFAPLDIQMATAGFLDEFHDQLEALGSVFR